MSENGRVAFPDVRELSKVPTDTWEWWRGSPRCQGVVGMPSRMSGSFQKAPRIPGSGRKALPDIREWLGCLPGCLGVVASPSQMSGSGWEALLDVQDLSGGPLRCPGVVGDPA